MKPLRFFLAFFLCAAILLMSGCEDTDIPPAENEEETITDITLTFTPQGGGNNVTASAQDPDGEGPADLQVQEAIQLAANTTYELIIELENSIASEDITEEIREEAEEHLFFFGWTEGLFSSPAGNGNIDQRADEVAYSDQDSSGLPLGLETTWTTGDPASGTFTILLKHQPDIKSETSTAEDGESDVNLTWNLSIQ